MATLPIRRQAHKTTGQSSKEETARVVLSPRQSEPLRTVLQLPTVQMQRRSRPAAPRTISTYPTGDMAPAVVHLKTRSPTLTRHSMPKMLDWAPDPKRFWYLEPIGLLRTALHRSDSGSCRKMFTLLPVAILFQR